MQYCGRTFSTPDIELIQGLIAEGLNRLHLSRRFCEKIDWRKPDGGLKEMSCRVALLRMRSVTAILSCLLLKSPANNHPKKPKRITLPLPTTGNVGMLRSTSLTGNERTLERLYRPVSLPRLYALTGCAAPVLREIGRDHSRTPGFAAAALEVRSRDAFIGWDAQAREPPPHREQRPVPDLVKVRNLASRILALAAKRIAADWHTRYGYAPVLLETFVDTERFTGTCYKAGNWRCVGVTQGRGKLRSLPRAPAAHKERLALSPG